MKNELKVAEETISSLTAELQLQKSKIQELQTASNREVQAAKDSFKEQISQLDILKEREGVLSEALQAAQAHISNLESDREKIIESTAPKIRELEQQLGTQAAAMSDLQEQLELTRQQLSKGDEAGSSKVLEKLRSDLQASQKQAHRLEEENLLGCFGDANTITGGAQLYGLVRLPPNIVQRAWRLSARVWRWNSDASGGSQVDFVP